MRELILQLLYLLTREGGAIAAHALIAVRRRRLAIVATASRLCRSTAQLVRTFATCTVVIVVLLLLSICLFTGSRVLQ